MEDNTVRTSRDNAHDVEPGLPPEINFTEIIERLKGELRDALEEAKPRALYSREQAARELGISESSLDMLIYRRLIPTVRKGRRVLIKREDLERFAAQQIPQIWPPKRDGKTTRHFAPPKGRPPRRTNLRPERKKTA